MIKALFMILLMVTVPMAFSESAQSVEAQKTRPISEGMLYPFYPSQPKETEILVKSFSIDTTPVTNADFLSFVIKNPKWRRGTIKKIFADGNYLKHWKGPLTLGDAALKDQPVTNVSWFAAQAYCEYLGKSLPTENQWEYVHQASNTSPDSRKDMEWRNKILAWYTTSGEKMSVVGKTEPNFWGVYDMNGLIWEWVLDFNNSVLSVDSRENGTDKDKSKFCGSGALAASEKDDYPSFMRMAFRSSLKADYTTKNLGFRCAQ